MKRRYILVSVLLMLAVTGYCNGPDLFAQLRIQNPGKISNIDWIPLRIVLRFPEGDEGKVTVEAANVSSKQPTPAPSEKTEKIITLRAMVVASNTSAHSSNIDVQLNASDSKTKSPTDILLEVVGQGQEGQDRYVDVNLAIPVSQDEKEKAVQKCLQSAVAEAEKNKAKDPSTAAIYESVKGREAMANVLRAMYFQNRVGVFGISAEVRYDAPKQPQKVIKLPAVMVDIPFRRDFFDHAPFNGQSWAK